MTMRVSTNIPTPRELRKPAKTRANQATKPVSVQKSHEANSRAVQENKTEKDNSPRSDPTNNDSPEKPPRLNKPERSPARETRTKAGSTTRHAAWSHQMHVA